MSVLLDTNVLLRLGDPSSGALAAVERETETAARVLLVPQVLTEYWVVATRPPSANGFGLTAAQALMEIRDFRDQFELIYDTASCHTNWEDLVSRYNVLGKQAHDARLVAAMLAHGIESILTFNATDFLRFEEIKVLVP